MTTNRKRMEPQPVLTPESEPTVTRAFAAFGHHFRFATPLPLLTDHLARCFEGFDVSSATDVHQYEIAFLPDDSYRISVDGYEAARPRVARYVLPAMFATLNRRVIESITDMTCVHAAVAVLPNGSGILMPGESGSGKSTLAAELSRRGAIYVTDELAVINDRDLTIHPYPKPITVGAGSWTALSELGHELPQPLQEFFGLEWALPAAAIGAIAAAPVEVRKIAQIRFTRQASDCRQLSTSETIMALVENSLDIQARGQASLDTLGAFARRASSISIAYGSADVAIASLTD